MQTRSRQTQARRFTVGEYHLMSQQGIIDVGERTELLDGQIMLMAAKGTAHCAATTLTKTVFETRLAQQATIRVQDPIRLNDSSEPEPDIAIVERDPLAYSTHHPTPEEVLLVIEIADSSLKYDLEVKAMAYAKANIREYWVLDVIERRLHLFRQPSPTGYQVQSILAEGLEVSPSAFPDCVIMIRALLPPQP